MALPLSDPAQSTRFILYHVDKKTWSKVGTMLFWGKNDFYNPPNTNI
jgi:hypothetical protein